MGGAGKLALTALGGRLLRRPAGGLPAGGLPGGGLVRRWRNGAAFGEQVAELLVGAGLVPGEHDGVRVAGACGHVVAVAGGCQAAGVVVGGEVDVAVAEEVRFQEVDAG